MKPIRDALVCGLLLAAILLVLQGIMAMRSITSTIEGLPLVVDNAVSRESAAIRKDFKETALSASAEIGRRAERQIGQTRKALTDEIRESRTELLSVTKQLAVRLDTELAATGGATRALMARYQRIPDEAAYATRQIWDCEGNPDCLENRYVSVSRAVEAASRTVQTTVPRMAVALERSANATAGSTEQTNLLIADVRTYFRPLPKPLQSAKIQVPAWLFSKFWPALFALF